MSILVPLIASGITMNEIPGRIAVYFELGNCTQGCPGCHSPHLTQQQVLAITPIEELEGIAETQATKGANAIVLMGGTTNGITEADLITISKRLSSILPVCLYSGRDDLEADQYIAEKAGLTWLKTGSYQEERGGLNSPITNQHFYECRPCYQYTIEGVFIGSYMELIDQTYLFQTQKGATCT